MTVVTNGQDHKASSKKRGLVIGKFYPLHKGHLHLIETGRRNCDVLHVVVCVLKVEKPEGGLRTSWVREIYRDHKDTVIVSELAWDGLDADDSQLWADLTKRHLSFVPDIVFTSENYGNAFCDILNCEHMLVDIDRRTVPVSGTLIRNDPLKYWQYIPEPAKEYYVKRVVIMGPESTGKTVMAEMLAKKYDTVWVPEYGREHCDIKPPDEEWGEQDFLTIAETQNQRENEYARKSNGIVFCDTNALATYVWHWRYMEKDSPKVLELSKHIKQPDLILLTNADVPYVQDGTREEQDLRGPMLAKFEQVLHDYKIPYKAITGADYDQRIQQAISFIDPLLHSPNSENL